MNRKFTVFAWIVLAWNVLVVLSGAYVRVTGAGAGCGNHWPLCNGEVVPLAPQVKTIIEFSHRALTGIDGPLVLVVLLWAFRTFPRGHAVRFGAVWSSAFLVIESFLGAALVKLDHVANNSSPYRAFSLSAHLLSTFSLLAFLALTAWWSMGNPRVRPHGRDAWRAGIAIGVVVLLGLTGVIAALGDTLFPVKSFAEGLARDFNASANFFVKLRVWHPAIAVFAAAWILYYAFLRARSTPRLAFFVMGAVLAQVLAGVSNLVLAAPGWLQLVHLLLADSLWISLILLIFTPGTKESALLRRY